MKGFRIANLVTHIFLFLDSMLLAIAPSGLALLSGALTAFGLDFASMPFYATALIAGFFILYALLSIIFGIVDFLAFPSRKRTYVTVELIVCLIGLVGCFAVLLYYKSLVSLPFRLLLSQLTSPVMKLAALFILLCLLNMAFTILYAAIRKKPAPSESKPLPPGEYG